MLHVDDSAFVRAPAPLVYRRLTDIGRWPTWWRGLRAQPMADGSGRETWALELAPSRWRGLRVALQPHTYRHDVGFRMTVSGDLEGVAEFWLEPADGGTVVHHLLSADAAGSQRAALRLYRAAARHGLWGFKDAIQAEVRTAVGLEP